VRRDHAQDVFLAPIRDELLTPERIKRMVGEMETYYRDQPRLRTKAAAEAPRDLRELEARIARLRDRLGRGDPVVRRYAHLSAEHLAPYADRLCARSVVSEPVNGTNLSQGASEDATSSAKSLS